jgi:tetratricopeptide (TPR) repeat protein
LNENAGNLNLWGYLLMSQKKNDEALSIFKNNVEKYPDNWNVYDSLGEAYNNFGNKNESIKYYKLALDIAPENQKQRIEDILKSIK